MGRKTAWVLVLLGVILSAEAATAQVAGGLDALTRVRPGVSRAVTSSAADFNSNFDRRTYIQPGETMELADVAGPGVINHIWLTFAEARPNWLEADGTANPGEIVLRMYWDNAAAPAVETPLGDFFAAAFGMRHEVKSVAVAVEDGDGYNAYWQMPFFERARITVTNEGAKRVRSFYYQIDYTEVPELPADTAYFCAQYNQAFPETLGEDYLILDAEGQGHYVGTFMAVQSRSPYWFGEGDARIYVDGDTEPTIQGTGTEDYFLSAWGFREHSFPTFGAPYLSDDPSNLGMRASMYRWHIDDPIRFTKSLRFEIEHTGWISADETESGEVDGHVEREDDVASVAFWYQIGQPKRFTTLPDAAERVFPDLDHTILDGGSLLGTARHSDGTVELQAGYDWSGDGQVFFVPATENAWLELDFDLPEHAYSGLVIRFTHAADYGRYRVLLDGSPVAEMSDYPDWNPRGPLDFYSPRIQTRDLYLGSYALGPGRHTLRLESAGANPASVGRALGVDSVRLRQRWDRKRPSLRPANPEQ